jgi:hypothetical protein
MIDQILKFVLDNLQPILIAVLGAILAFGVRELRSLSKKLVVFAESFAAEAAKTPSKSDDVGAAVVLSIARALSVAVDKEISKK